MNSAASHPHTVRRSPDARHLRLKRKIPGDITLLAQRHGSSGAYAGNYMGPTAGSQPPTPPYEAFFYTGSLVDSLFNTISTPRLGKYLTLADEDRTLAIQLYTWNIALSASLYGFLGYEQYL